MEKWLHGWFWGVGLLALGLGTAGAFLPNPDLLTISPPVARAGTTVEVSIEGKDLDEVRTLRFADERIVVRPVMKAAGEVFPEPQPVPNRFEVTIPEEVEPGIYEVRSLGYFGLSTARPFLVVEKEAREIAETGDHSSPDKAQAVEVNSGVTGFLDSRKIDWYKLRARGGERVLLQVWAERIDSRADVLLTLFDKAGRELESSRHHFGRDPLVDFTAAEDGEVWVAVADALYRGSAQYFYRLEISTKALVDFVFPPAALAGTEANLVFHGRNLPGGSLGDGLELGGKPLETVALTLTVPEQPGVPGGIFPGLPRQGLVPAFEHRLGDAPPVRIGFATAPVVEEVPGEEVQRVEAPCEVAGRFDGRGDRDRYRFAAKKGQVWWLEVMSERLGARTDPFLVVEKVERDAQGSEKRTKVAEGDDPPSFYGADSLDDLNADTLDPALSFTASEDGEYEVTIGNRSGGGSIAHLYRLAIREARPDFQLISGTELTKTINNDAYPMAPLLRRGGSMVYRILALRQDGFDGEIVVETEGLPEGVSASPLVLDGGAREGYLALQAAPDAAAWSGPVRMVGRAKIGEEEVRREARSASIVWGTRVFANQRQVRSRLDQENVLSVIDTETEPCRIGPAEEKEWTVELRQKLEIPVRVSDVGTRKGSLQVEVFGFPGMLRNPPTVQIPEGQGEGILMIDFTPTGTFAVKPGRYQFVLQGIGNASYVRNPEGAKRAAEEVKRLVELGKKFGQEAEAAREAVKKAEETVKAAEQAVAGAPGEEERVALGQAVEKAKAYGEAARKEVAAAEQRVKEVEAARLLAEKAAEVAAKLAQEATSRFATYSLPVTVEVREAEGK